MRVRREVVVAEFDGQAVDDEAAQSGGRFQGDGVLAVERVRQAKVRTPEMPLAW